MNINSDQLTIVIFSLDFIIKFSLNVHKSIKGMTYVCHIASHLAPTPSVYDHADSGGRGHGGRGRGAGWFKVNRLSMKTNAKTLSGRQVSTCNS